MKPEEAYLVEKHLQIDSELVNIGRLHRAAMKYKAKLPRVAEKKEAMRKARVCQEMEALVSGNFEGWDLRYNEPGYGSNGGPIEAGLYSVSIYRGKKFLGHRLVAPNASAEKALAEISNAFLVAMEKAKEVEKLKEAKNHNTLEKRQKATVHGQH